MARRSRSTSHPSDTPLDTTGPDFVHLHVHSEYSLLDGLGRIPEIVGRAKALGQRAIALTDHGNLHGVVEFHREARNADVTPIIGCEVYVAPRTLRDREPKIDERSFHLTLLARNEAGYRNLLRLVSTASIDGFYYKPRVDRDLLEAHSVGITALSGCMSGELARLVMDGQTESATRTAAWHRDVFGPSHYFIEVQNQNLPGQESLNRGLLEIAAGLGVRVVATNDAHYVHAADHKAHDILLCIQTGATVDQPGRMRLGSQEFFLRSGAEMARAFPGMPEVLSNTLVVAEQIDLNLDFSRVNLPRFEVPDGETASSYLRALSFTGIEQRYGQVSPEQRERLEYELSVIDRTGYPLYFLIVADYVRFARARGILAMPRGSVAGSLVIHALGVCDIDPLAYNLMFERFLHEERIGMPDIDMDFADDRREEVIRYVQEKYGRDRVAQIITFGTMAARAAIRDVARVMGLSLSEVNPIARAIPFGASLAEAREIPEIRALAEADPRIGEVLDLAENLEGVCRNASTHAAGIVISSDPLVDHVPLQRGTKGEDTIVTQWAMGAVEQAGMIKMDFLGLANLTIVDRTLQILRTFHGIELDINTIPTDDGDPQARTAFTMLGEGETTAVFQLESDGMRRCLRGLRPNKVSDLIAIVALYRPGPMENIPAFTAAKNGQVAVSYLHPVLEPILAETYGICVYQDQVLQMVREVAGFSWGEADVLRKAMGKKIASLMDEQEAKFTERARERGFSDSVVASLWQIIAPFAGYGFPKGHAAAYAILAYQTAFLKANYTAAYMAAVLTSMAGTPDKVSEAIADARRLGVSIGAPDINRSGHGFTLETGADGATGIRFGLSGVKFVGSGAIDSLIVERNTGGDFSSLANACERLDLRQWNKRAIESLIKAGALDGFGERVSMLASIDTAITAGQQVSKARMSGQTSLFDLFADANATTPDPAPVRAIETRDRTVADRRQILTWEKEAMGLYLSEHPLTAVAHALRAASTCAITEITPEMAGDMISIAGHIASVRPVQTRKGDTMAAVQLEDLSGSIELVVFPRTYAQSRALFVEDTVVLIRGRVDLRTDTPQITCETIEAFDADRPVADIPEAPRSRKGRASTPDTGSGRAAGRVARSPSVQETVVAPEVVDDQEVRHEKPESADTTSPAIAPTAVVDHSSISQVIAVEPDLQARTAPMMESDDPWAGMDVVASPATVPTSRAASNAKTSVADANLPDLAPPNPLAEGADVAEAIDEPMSNRAVVTEPGRQPASERNGHGVGTVDITMNRELRDDRDLRRIQAIDDTIRAWPGKIPVVVRLVHPNGTTVAIEASQHVHLSRGFLDALELVVGLDAITIRADDAPPAVSPTIDGLNWPDRATA